MYKKIPYQTGRQLLDRFSSSDEAQALIDEAVSYTHLTLPTINWV